MAILLDEHVRFPATTRTRATSPRRKSAAGRTGAARAHATGEDGATPLPGTDATANPAATPSTITPQGYYWIVGLVICIAAWGSILGALAGYL